MKNPFVGRSILIYFGIWAVVMAANSAFLHFVYEFPLIVSITDGVSSHIITSGLALSFWYLVQYLSPKSPNGIFTTVLNIGLAVLLAASLSYFLSQRFLSAVFLDDTYLQFVKDSAPWRIFVNTLLLAIVVMLYYIFRYNHDLYLREQDSLKLQNMLKESELEMLKFQINPHFIFNSLNSISGLTITAPDQAREMVIKLSEFLRSSLGPKNNGLHSLATEIEQMTLYLDIEKVRFGDRLQVDYKLDDKCNNMLLPNMILQPLYENAVKYGIYERLEDVTITTTARCEQGTLKVSISNDYDCEQKAPRGSGIGLKNIQNRLELIYGKSDLVTIEKTQKQFTIRLTIPQL